MSMSRIRRSGVLLVMVFASAALGQQDYSGVREARKRQNEAQAAHRKAQMALNGITAKQKRLFQAGEEWKKSEADVKQAQQQVDAARAAVAEKLKSDPGYQKALAEKKKTEETKARLRAENAPPEKMVDVVMAARDAAAAVQKLEEAAMASDQDASKAREALATAKEAQAVLLQQFEEQLKANPEWEAAKKEVDAAQERVTAANAEVQNAVKALAQSRQNK